jgi:predicted permease
MDLALITVKKILEMFFILLIGVAACKLKAADSTTGSRMTSILLYVVSPCVILMSYQMEFDKNQLVGLAVTAGLSFASFLAAIIISGLVAPKHSGPDMAVERMSIVYSNCGFIGIPLVEGLLGGQGVFYMTSYLTVFNLFVWSHGIILMKGKTESFQDTVKNFIQPSNLAIFAGLLLYISGIKLPKLMADPVAMIGSMNTPMAMLISGINLAESDLLSSLRTPRTYLLSVARLIIVPLVTLVLLMVVHVDRVIAVTVLIAAACPSGAMGTMFAMQYHKNSQYASKLLAITTSLSLLTIPVIMLAAGRIFL